jgi:hypothetical protein
MALLRSPLVDWKKAPNLSGFSILGVATCTLSASSTMVFSAHAEIVGAATCTLSAASTMAFHSLTDFTGSATLVMSGTSRMTFSPAIVGAATLVMSANSGMVQGRVQQIVGAATMTLSGSSTMRFFPIGTTPPERSATIPRDNRTQLVGAETRSTVIPAERRVM